MTGLSRRRFLALAAAAVADLHVAKSGAARHDRLRVDGGAKTKDGFKTESVREYRGEAIPEDVLRLEYASGVDGARDWALLLPRDKCETWAVMIHGHGSNGDQLYTHPRIRPIWFPAIQKHQVGILTPNLRDSAWMSPPAAADLRCLLNYVREQHGAKRFVLASGSMGGTSNLIYACLHPEDAAAVVAVCPATDLPSYVKWCRRDDANAPKGIADAIEQAYGGPPEKNPKVYHAHSAVRNARKLTMPVYVAHGTADDVIPVSQPRRLAAAMGDAVTFVYVEVPDGGHDAPLGSLGAGLDWVMRKVTA